jgi:hypothetical protein
VGLREGLDTEAGGKILFASAEDRTSIAWSIITYYFIEIKRYALEM